MSKRFLMLVAAATFTALLLVSGAALAQGGVAVAVDEVNDAAFPSMGAAVTVVDPNGVPLQGLTAANFELSEDGKPIPGFQVSPLVNPQIKIAVALAIDASGSMVGEPFQDAKDAAMAFLDGLAPMDEVAIIVFAGEVDLGEPFPQLQDGRELDFTSDKGALKNLLTLADAVERTRTPLYDAAFKAIKMTVRQQIGRRAVILFTDGSEKAEDERVSTLKADDPINEATKYGIPVFTIGLGPQADEEYLRRISLLTGGTYAYAEASEDLAPLFQQIADQLKQQYTLTWESRTAVDFSGHQGLVRVKTSMGDAGANFAFDATPAGVWIRQLLLREGTETRPLVGNQQVQGLIQLEPEVYAQSGIDKVEYYVDDTLRWTASDVPFGFAWNTAEAGAGLHTLMVKAYDNAVPQNVGEESIVLDIVIPPPPPPWVLIIAAAAVVLAAGAALLLYSRRKRPRICPVCGRVMDPGWTECLFCATEGTTEAGQVSVGELVEAITSLERVGAPPEAAAGVAAPVAPPKTEILHPEPQPMAWLIVERGEREGHQFRLHAGDTSIGRSGDNDIILGDPTVGRQQAKVRLEGNSFYIYDLAATNPTLVNDRRVTKHLLEEGDRVQVGNTVLVFKRV